MVEHFWFKFEWAAYQNDKKRRRCSLETRGFWDELFVEMEATGTYFIEGTIQEIANIAICSTAKARKCLDELDRTKTAKVTKSQENIKVVSRRLLKRYNLREYNKLKQQEHRRQERVKKLSNESSKIKSLREDKNKKEDKNGGKPPTKTDPVQERIWKDGVDLLARSGLSEKSARAFLGSQAKEFTKERLAEAIAVTLAKNPPDPKPYIVAVLQDRVGASDRAKAQVGKHNDDEPLPAPEPCGVCGKDVCFSLHRE